MSCLKRPAGRADKEGSQQCEFTMAIPSLVPLREALAVAQYYPNKVYSINSEGEVEFADSTSKDTYYVDDLATLGKFCMLHGRGLDEDIPLFESTKGVAPTKENGHKEISTVTTMAPPLILEVCTRSYGRRVLVGSFNVVTLNDLDGLKLPPHFQYAEGMDHTFRLHALRQARGLRREGHKVSQKFAYLCQKYLGPINSRASRA